MLKPILSRLTANLLTHVRDISEAVDRTITFDSKTNETAIQIYSMDTYSMIVHRRLLFRQ